MLEGKEGKRIQIEEVIEASNMSEAWMKVKANQGGAGVDGMGMEETQEHLKRNWEKIQEKLIAGQYKPAAVKLVEIPKANGGQRALGIPNIQDRLIQQAIHQILSPLWEAEFSEYSYGFRPHRSQHDAVKKAQEYVESGKGWVVDIDLKNFFDEVNQDRLMRQIAEKVRDKRLLRLIGDCLRSPLKTAKGEMIRRNKGTTQGSPLSPFLANIYLDPLDKELEKRGLAFVRYADDIAIFVSSERSAERVMESIIEWIEQVLKLPVNREKSKSGPSDESGLLGFRIYTDGRVGVNPKAVKRLKETVKEIWNSRQNLTSEQLRDRWREYIQGWWNYFKMATWKREVENQSGWIRRKMRQCFWKRWSTPQGRANALLKLGVKGRAVGNAYSRKGSWAMAKHWVTHQALSNKTLERYGFIIPWSTVGIQT